MNPIKKLFGSRHSAAPLQHLEQIYRNHVGEIHSVLHETENRGNHVDVYRFNSRQNRPFVTYITGGMSRRAQPHCEEFSSVELLLYATHHDPRLPEAVRQFSHYPWETGAAFLGWDLLPLGENAGPMLGSDRFGGILVCPSTRREDQCLAASMRGLTPAVSPLNLVPLLSDEFEYAASTGIKQFLDRVSASNHSIVLDHARESVLSDTLERNLQSGIGPNAGRVTPLDNPANTDEP